MGKRRHPGPAKGSPSPNPAGRPRRLNAVKQIGVKLTAEDLRRLETFADAEHRTLAESVRVLIRRHLPN
jgi:hypothetical protein